MFGVRLGDSWVRAGAVLGKPGSVRPPAWSYGPHLGERVSFDGGGRVVDVWTDSVRERTNRGIGVGASLRSVLKAYPRSRCYTVDGVRGRICILVSRYRGRPVETDFLFGSKLRAIEIFFR